MDDERAANLLRMDFGGVASYGPGRFAYKILPNTDRLSKEQVESRIAAREPRQIRDWLTRDNFPLGSAGRLAYQAWALLAGIDHHAVWDDDGLAGFTELVERDDGSRFVPDAPLADAASGHDTEGRVLRWMGSIVTATTHSAFACELALKAISLTYNDEAQKTHDLSVLLEDLPDVSLRRLEADHRELALLLEHKRQTFGAWRYFEINLPDGGMNALIDVATARDLGRAARVLLDEAELVGLRAGFSFEASRTTEETDSGRRRDRFSVRVTSNENPPAQTRTRHPAC